MPFDGHSYLVAQGWTGKGTGLRKGAISRPLAIPQKKTLSGLGKDRDEAFPFWDHLFSAAAKSIQLKCTSDEENEDDIPILEFKRTNTGILSTRRPIVGTPADSGSNTPDGAQPRASLLSIAKREAAKRGLYARFFRGPVLGPDILSDDELSKITSHERTKKKRKREKGEDYDEQVHKGQRKELRIKLKDEKKSKKRRKEYDSIDDAERSERKEERRRRREARAAKKTFQDKQNGDRTSPNEKLIPREVSHQIIAPKPSDHGGQTPGTANVFQDVESTKKKKKKRKEGSS